jgi:hypothetical protein
MLATLKPGADFSRRCASWPISHLILETHPIDARIYSPNVSCSKAKGANSRLSASFARPGIDELFVQKLVDVVLVAVVHAVDVA